MSGHSKWSTIKRKKGVADAKRGKLFSKLAKQITVAARQNSNLDVAIAAAKAANMPKDNIDRAIKKGTGEFDGGQIEEGLYEVYGPGGAALLVEVLTDNTNRTLGGLRAVLNKLGGNLAQTGAVQFLFDRKSVVEVPAGDDPDVIQLTLIEAGVDDVAAQDDRVAGYGPPTAFSSLQSSIKSAGLTVADARLAWVPKTLQPVDDSTAKKVIQLMEAIDDLDDVQSVETNAEL